MEGPTEETQRVKQGRMYRWTADADRREVEEEPRREDNRQRARTEDTSEEASAEE